MTSATTTQKYRIESIDILRGAVMLIMAIDHIRDFFHGSPDPTDLSVTTPILFFTRLITHFCAPVFVFLSGISAYLAGTRRTQNQLAWFLIKRGLWLLFVEVAFITLAITFNPLYNVLVLQVIWAIGGSMILLGLLIMLRVPLGLIGVIGAIIFFGHNLIDVVKIDAIEKTFAGKLFLSSEGFGTFWPTGTNRGLLLAYALLPWAGVMFLGYAFGTIYQKTYDAAKRRKMLLYTGLGLLLLFLILRSIDHYGDPAPWAVQKTTALTVISFLNVTKYPCSLQYLSLTLGVGLTVLALVEGVKNRLTSILIVFGNVPFFYYICHWYLIRLTTVVIFFAQGYNTSQIIGVHNPLLFQPKGFGFNLFGVYVIWVCVMVILYFPCRWFSNYKKTHTQWWLSYL